MSREMVRQLRQAVSNGATGSASVETQRQAQAAAVQLLERSVCLGHRRLSVVRLSAAAQSGAQIPITHWRYCFGVAKSSQDPRIKELFNHATQLADVPQEFTVLRPRVRS